MVSIPFLGLLFAIFETAFVFFVMCYGMARYSMYMEKRLATGHRH